MCGRVRDRPLSLCQPFARWAGLSILQLIQPGELTPKVISDALAHNPEVVIDILHFLIAKLIVENIQCRCMESINFPGTGGTKTLEDLFEYNTAPLLKAFQ